MRLLVVRNHKEAALQQAHTLYKQSPSDDLLLYTVFLKLIYQTVDEARRFIQQTGFRGDQLSQFVAQLKTDAFLTPYEQKLFKKAQK